MATANRRPENTSTIFEYLDAAKVWLLRRALAKTLKREEQHREALRKCRAEMADLERRLERAELEAACRVAYRQG